MMSTKQKAVIYTTISLWLDLPGTVTSHDHQLDPLKMLNPGELEEKLSLHGIAMILVL